MRNIPRTGQIAAVDLGASSGRVVLGTVGPDYLKIRQVARFANKPLEIWNGERATLHWDIAGLFGELGKGLATAARQAPWLLGVGIDSWAIDYGLLRGGQLLGLPYTYRDARSSRGEAAVGLVVSQAELFERNGLQHLPFTTVYQLAADKLDGILDAAEHALLIPDLIGYWLTGVMASERTNASTTGLLDVGGGWDRDLIARLGLSLRLFPPLAEPGDHLGAVMPAVADQLSLERSLQVTHVASHDTASAVVAAPMAAESSAYISCGTWGLVGVELSNPNLSAASRAANFTNEAGADGRVRFLRNVTGLWLLSESVRQWARDGVRVELPRLLESAEVCPPPAAVFDVDDVRFLAPGDIPSRISAWYTERGLPTPETRAEFVRAIVESLAVAFAQGVHAAAVLSGTDVRTVHVVGGGAQNRLLCRLIADHVGLPVLAGPVEATSIGNILIQARTHKLLSGDLDSLRSVAAAAYPPQRYSPRPATSIYKAGA
ncbi:rhamnulokinase [Nocardia thailandica]